MPNMVVTDPMPIDSISTATRVNPGFLASILKPKRRSCNIPSPKLAPRDSRHSSRMLCTLPNRFRASRAASSGAMPAAMFSAVRCSRWNRSSSSISRFTSRRSHSERILNQIVRNLFTL